jgi:hypothetical protein
VSGGHEEDPYGLRTTSTVRRVFSETLPAAVSAAAYEFITGPHRIGKRLLPPMDNRFSARRCTAPEQNVFRVLRQGNGWRSRWHARHRSERPGRGARELDTGAPRETAIARIGRAPDEPGATGSQRRSMAPPWNWRPQNSSAISASGANRLAAEAGLGTKIEYSRYLSSAPAGKLPDCLISR